MDKWIWKNKNRNRRKYKQSRNKETQKRKFEIKRRIRNTKKSDCHIYAKIEDKVKFIENNKKVHDVRTMCKVLGIARSEYYYQRNKKKNRYKEANGKLDKEILKEYEKSKGRYGLPKVQKALEKRGIKASQKRVARRMKKMGLKSIIVKKYRPSGSKGK